MSHCLHINFLVMIFLLLYYYQQHHNNNNNNNNEILALYFCFSSFSYSSTSCSSSSSYSSALSSFLSLYPQQHHLFQYISICVSIYLSVYLSICVSIHLPIYFSLAKIVLWTSFLFVASRLTFPSSCLRSTPPRYFHPFLSRFLLTVLSPCRSCLAVLYLLFFLFCRCENVTSGVRFSSFLPLPPINITTKQ